MEVARVSFVITYVDTSGSTIFRSKSSVRVSVSAPNFIYTIRNVREGIVYVKSDGSDVLKISKGSNSFDQWTTWLYVKNPDGSLKQEFEFKSSEGATSHDIVLDKPGDYQIAIANGMRLFTFQSTNKLVLQTNARKRTFRDLTDDHATKFFFYVPFRYCFIYI